MRTTRSAARVKLSPPTTNGTKASPRPKLKRQHSENTTPPRPSKERKRTTKSSVKAEDAHDKSKPSKKSSKVKKEEIDTPTDQDTSPKKPKSSKDNKYNLTPGQSPFPNWSHPTPSECEEVVRRLSKLHGKVKAPAKIPTPSLQSSGCGEVPSVLDALIRTRLSAATNNNNSSRAFRGLVSKFGIIKSGVGKGSVNWNAVRRADTGEIYEAIKCGGLADVKSRDIKSILQMVWEENKARRNALVDPKSEPHEDNADSKSAVKIKTEDAEGAEDESDGEKKQEIAKSDENVVSLDHLHLLSNDDAFAKLIKYPGVGPKTASCVLLFCLQRPSFAVDTHVFRLCKMLGWVPASKATRNTTYAHCDVRIPDHLKYPLHRLLIKHGQTCESCRAMGWQRRGGAKDCPLRNMMKEDKSVRNGDDKSSSSSVGSDVPDMSDMVESQSDAASADGTRDNHGGS